MADVLNWKNWNLNGHNLNNVVDYPRLWTYPEPWIVHLRCSECGQPSYSYCYVIAIQTDANVLYNIRSLIPQLKQTRPLSGSPISPLPASSHTTTVVITSPGRQPTFHSHSPRPAHIECHTNKLQVHALSYPQLTYSVYKSVYKFPCLPHFPQIIKHINLQSP